MDVFNKQTVYFHFYFNATNKGFIVNIYQHLDFNVITPHLGLLVVQVQLRLNLDRKSVV